MQRLEVSGAVRLIYKSLGVKGLKNWEFVPDHLKLNNNFSVPKEYQHRRRYSFMVIIQARKYDNKYKQEQLL